MATSLKSDAVSFAPLHPDIGAEVRGVDLRRDLDADTIGRIKQV